MSTPTRRNQYVFMGSHANRHTHTHAHTCIHARPYAPAHTDLPTHKQTPTHTFTNTYTHTRTRTHSHTRTINIFLASHTHSPKITTQTHITLHLHTQDSQTKLLGLLCQMWQMNLSTATALDACYVTFHAYGVRDAKFEFNSK